MNPFQNTPRRGDSRCCRCSRLIRIAGLGTRITSREEATLFSSQYNYSIQPNQSLCSKCLNDLKFKKARLAASSGQTRSAESLPSASSLSLRNAPSSSRNIVNEAGRSAESLPSASSLSLRNAPSSSRNVVNEAGRSAESLPSASSLSLRNAPSSSRNVVNEAGRSAESLPSASPLSPRNAPTSSRNIVNEARRKGESLPPASSFSLRNAPASTTNTAIETGKNVESHPSAASLFHRNAPQRSRRIVNEAGRSAQCIPSASLLPIENESSSQLSNRSSVLESTSSQSSSQESQQSLYTPDEGISKDEIEYINMPFNRVTSSHGYCFICKCKENLIDVPFEARIQVFVIRRLFIPKRNRCCQSHLIKNQFYEDEIGDMVIFANECFIDVLEINNFLEKLSTDVHSDVHGKIGNQSMSNERIKALTGHSWDAINKITEKLTTMRKSHNRDQTQAMVIFLIKLRSGASDAFIAAILDVSERVVNQSINSILDCFRTHILPENFGIQVYSREVLLQQQAPIVGLLYDNESDIVGGDNNDHDDRLYLICDGTYLRHEKSSNNAYQRKSFSGQKKTSLCKPFTISTTNGFVVDLEGPFEANLNDAEILRNLLQDPQGLMTILKKGDVFILDRGFRDVKPFLEEKGFKVLMPALKGQRKQLTTNESNESRFVTKIRWVVEAVHGIISQKCELLHKMRNSLLPNAGTYCKAACYIHNVTGQRLNSDSKNLNAIVSRMKIRKYVDNDMAKMVTENNYGRKTKPFQSGSSEDFNDFPQLTEDELKLLFTGTYQLKQAISYLGELLDTDDHLRISYLIEDKGILKVEVKSRHINSKTYKCFVHYEPAEDGIDAIKGHCCDCANGLRTVGCCSHIAAIIYYLSYGRFLSKIIRPAEKLSHLFQVDNIIPVINEDSDED